MLTFKESSYMIKTLKHRIHESHTNTVKWIVNPEPTAIFRLL